MKQLGLLVSLAVVLTIMVGCSALDKLKGKNSGGTTYDLTGSWEVVATSTENPGVISIVEFNAKQESNGDISAPVQEFIFGTSATVLGNCLGVIPGNPQGNLTATEDNSSITNITGNFTETGPGGSASFSVQAPLTSATTFSGNFVGAASNPAACKDGGTFVATQTSPLSGSYSGQLTYPDGSHETVSVTMTQDSTYNITVTGSATGGMQDGPINLTGKVTGNLAVLNGADKNGQPVILFAWWNGAGLTGNGGTQAPNLAIVDNTGYPYGTLARH
jgi:hypothetical protein